MLVVPVRWLSWPVAKESFQNIQVHLTTFAAAMREILTKSRGRFRKITIAEPANCAETFLLSLLHVIFEAISNLANTKLAE